MPKIRRFRTTYCKICHAPEKAIVVRKNHVCHNCLSQYRKQKYDTDPSYREKLLRSSRIYFKSHPDKRREKERKKEAREKGLPGSHTEKEWNELLEKCHYHCVLCGNQFPQEELTRDHIIPKTVPGSTDYISNIQPMCRRCNSRKGNRSTEDLRPI